MRRLAWRTRGGDGDLSSAWTWSTGFGSGHITAAACGPAMRRCGSAKAWGHGRMSNAFHVCHGGCLLAFELSICRDKDTQSLPMAKTARDAGGSQFYQSTANGCLSVPRMMRAVDAYHSASWTLGTKYPIDIRRRRQGSSTAPEPRLRARYR